MWIILILLVLFTITVIAFSFSNVQTRAAQWTTSYLNDTYDTQISIKKVHLKYDGDVILEQAVTLDHKSDTLFSFSNLNTSILGIGELIAGKPELGDVRIDDLYFNLKRYRTDERDNMSLFLEKFRTNAPQTNREPFQLNASRLQLNNASVSVIDETLRLPKSFVATQMNVDAANFSIVNGKISAAIEDSNFIMYNDAMRYIENAPDLQVDKLQADFSYSSTAIVAHDLVLETAGSKIKGDLDLNYTQEDFRDFTDKVRWNFNVESANLSTNEIGYFYNQLIKNETIQLSGHMTGVLNDFKVKDLAAYTLDDISIVGDAHLVNMVDNTDEFFIEGTFNTLQASGSDLEKFLPRILNRVIPLEVKSLGTISASGYAAVDSNTIVSRLKGTTRKGSFNTNISLTDITSGNIGYKGNIKINRFNLAALTGVKSLGNATLDLDVNGRGFSARDIDTKLKGKVNSLEFNGYTYTNVQLDGELRNPLFDGNLVIDDPNLQMTFDGLADLSAAINKYDFTAQVKYANLKAINVFTRDSISEFKGDIIMNAQGTTLDDATGELEFINTNYTNQNNDYFFEDFIIDSYFEDEERHIVINSPDIIEGEMSGKFKLEEIPELFKNAIGNVYTNYQSETITQNQYLNYEFNVYDKIVELIVPELTLGENTVLKGKVSSNDAELKMTFRTPLITYNDLEFNEVNVQIDNQNPIFNTFIKVDEVNNGVYDVKDFKLINVTNQDTLQFRTEFESKTNAADKFNLSFYHTVDGENKSVVGIKKSDVKFRGKKWDINEGKNDVRLKFDHDFTQFEMDTITARHNKERIKLSGLVRGPENKDIGLTFNDVRLSSLLQPIDSLKMRGKINGNFNLEQVEGSYSPSSDFTLNAFEINDTPLGDFIMLIEGNEDLTNYSVDAQLVNKDKKTFNATGYIDTTGNNSTISVTTTFNKFNLLALSPLGGIVLDKMRGLASGKAVIEGDLSSPDINGRVNLQNAGLRVPYLNTDFDLENNTVVKITSDSFEFNKVGLTDTKYGTQGILDGSIKHKNFGFWQLDLDLSSKRLLVLDTQLTEESLYYGTAFIDGGATIKGPTGELKIEVIATTQEGTVFKIPIDDGESIADTSAIYFLSPEEKAARISGELVEQKVVKGLELLFDLKVTPVAVVEITVDPRNGSYLRGSGYGNLQIEINTNGKFIMNGDFIATQGIYNFKYSGIVNKEFTIEPGGTVDWNGDPTGANIDVSASYRTRANPAVLLDNPNLNAQVPVEVITVLDGDLSYFDPEFQIRFPNAESVVSSELQYRLEDKAQRQLQALSLLISGSFYNPTSIGQNAVIGNGIETLSGLVNDLVSREGSAVNLGVTYDASERSPNSDIQRADRFGITLSTQISERVLINGKLGVPVGSTSAQERAVIGNVEVEFLLNQDGTLRLKLFNRENTIQQIGQQEDYTQGVGLQYSVDFDTLSELYKKIFNKDINKEKRIQQADSDVYQEPDTN